MPARTSAKRGRVGGLAHQRRATASRAAASAVEPRAGPSALGLGGRELVAQRRRADAPARGRRRSRPPRSGRLGRRRGAARSEAYARSPVAAELGEHRAVRRRRGARPAGATPSTVATPARSSSRTVVEVELAEAGVPARARGAAPRARSPSSLAAVEQREHLGDDRPSAGGGRVRRGAGSRSARRQRGERPLRVGEPGAQRLELVAGRRPPVGDVHDAERRAARRAPASRSAVRHSSVSRFMRTIMRPPSPRARSRVLLLASLARATAAVCASPSAMRMTRMFSCVRGIMTFSNRLTRCDGDAQLLAEQVALALEHVAARRAAAASSPSTATASSSQAGVAK